MGKANLSEMPTILCHALVEFEAPFYKAFQAEKVHRR